MHNSFLVKMSLLLSTVRHSIRHRCSAYMKFWGTFMVVTTHNWVQSFLKYRQAHTSFAAGLYIAMLSLNCNVRLSLVGCLDAQASGCLQLVFLGQTPHKTFEKQICRLETFVRFFPWPSKMNIYLGE